MSSMRKVMVVCLLVVSLTVFTTSRAKAEYCCFNPLALPFLVAGAVVGTAAAITTGILGIPYYAFSGPYNGYGYGPSYSYGSGYYYGPGRYPSSYYAPAPVYYGPGYYSPRFYGPGYGYYRSGAAWGPRYYGTHGRYGRAYHDRIGSRDVRVRRGVEAGSVRSWPARYRY
ncbi:MAG: hypothetical protein AB9873_09245 [Syntrophobacteraceae bacterium]